MEVGEWGGEVTEYSNLELHFLIKFLIFRIGKHEEENSEQPNWF